MNALASQRTEISLRQMIGHVLAVAWGGSTNGQAYAVFAVILSLMMMSLATTVRTKIVRSVSMRGDYEKRL